MTKILLTEISYGCGCHVAIRKKTIMVKLCRKHYEKFKHIPISEIIRGILGIYPIK